MGTWLKAVFSFIAWGRYTALQIWSSNNSSQLENMTQIENFTPPPPLTAKVVLLVIDILS